MEPKNPEDQFAEDSYTNLIYSEDQIKTEVDRVATEILENHRNNRILVVGILTGAFIFKADLLRAIRRVARQKREKIIIENDFQTASSYFHGKRSGDLRVVYDLNTNPKGKDIILLDDICDTGHTSSYLRDYLMFRKANSVQVGVVIRRYLEKALGNSTGKEPDYTCFKHKGSEFFVGYGMDDQGVNRDFPDIFEVPKS